MTNACNPEHPSKPTRSNNSVKKATWLLVLSRGGIALGGFLLIGLAGGAWRLWNFIRTELVPLAETSLTTTLNRPVELGDVKEFSLTGVKFGASALPATPTDRDKATVEAVEVSFDPLGLLLNRHLKLDVTLVNPDIYIEQDEQGNWITATIAPPGKEGPIKTDLDKLRVRNARLVLAPMRGGNLSQISPPETISNTPTFSSPSPPSPSSPQTPVTNTQSPVEFSQLNGTAQFLENNELIKYDINGVPKTGGNISIQGETHPKTLAFETNLHLKGDLNATEVTRLIKLPIFLLNGRVQADLKIPKLLLKQQSEKPKSPWIYGTATAQGVTLQVPKMPQPFINSQGNLRFDGSRIHLDNVRTHYGKIPLIASGFLDTETGFQLAARVNAVNIALARETLNIQLPFPTLGEVKADLQVLGTTEKPILLGKVATIKTARIDKVDFDSVGAQFEFSPVASVMTFKNIKGKAAVGGDITGNGKIQLNANPQLTQLNFNFKAQNISGDDIALLYGTKPPIQIGQVAAVGKLTGTPETIQTSVQWQAPQATYPATGEVTVAPNKTVSFRNVALRVAGGTVRAYGTWNEQQWQAVADASQIEVQRFVNPAQIQNVSLNDARFNGRFILSGTSAPFQIATIRPENARVQIAGGTVAVSNLQFNEQSFSAQLVASDIRLGRLLKTQIPPALTGPLAGKVQVSGNTSDFSLKTFRASGEGRIGIGNGTVTASNIQVGNGVYQMQLQANDIALQEVAQLPKEYRGKLTGQFNVAGSVESFQPQALQAIGQARVKIADGTVIANNIQLANGRYRAQLQANDVALQRLVPQLPPQFQGRLTGLFNVAGGIESFSPQAIQAIGQARVNFGRGSVTASNIQVANGRYQVQLQAQNILLQRLAQVPQQFYGNLTGQFNVAGSLEPTQLQAIRATGQAKLNVAGGAIAASNIRVGNGNYQAVVDASGVDLTRFSPDLRGRFGAKMQVAGRVGAFDIASVRAVGEVRFSQGISVIEQPLTASIGWDGKQVIVERATSADLNANGYIFAKTNRVGVPEITGLNLNVQAQNVNLQKLPLSLPNPAVLAGKADFGGRISGQLPVPDIQGQLRLRDLAVNQIAFESVLTGNIQLVRGQGFNLNVAGKRDRIALNAGAVGKDASWSVSTFDVRWQNAMASGQSKGDVLAMKVENFPLQILNIAPPATARLGTSAIAGLLTGSAEFNQKTFATLGNITIEKPQFGRIAGDRLSTQFRYSNGKATITNSEFAKGASRYALAGTFAQTAKGPQIQGKLNVTKGEIQDVLAVLQLYELQDVQRGMAEPTYGKAADLASIKPVGLPDKPLITQMQRLAEIDYLLSQQQQQRRDASPIPDLADLSGTFSGEVSVDTATATGLNANFNLNGQNFAWGRGNEPNRYYKAEQIVAQGKFENGVLTLLPLRLESENRLIAFTGNIGGKEQSGQLRVTNFPIQVLNNFVKLPVGLTGNLNATAALAGSINNPQAKGELEIREGTLNQKGVDSANASFSYNNGRLDFGSVVGVSGDEPVNISGSIPYKLPFATTAPNSNTISLDVKVKNEGLAILNLLNNQVAYESGEGEIDLKVRGNLQKPTLNGIAKISQGIFTSQSLPGKITDVIGKVNFDFDRVIVENLQGQYNNKGAIEAKGQIPISSKEKLENPLTVSLQQLAVNLKGLYQGGVDGKLEIAGSALSPVISGQMALDNGEVLLAEAAEGTTTPGTGSGIGSVSDMRLKQNKQTTPTVESNETRLNNLQITLGKNVKITRQPILSFRATGSLNVNGLLSQPVPEGTITLKEGSVNLFTTRFNLVRGYSHKAIFRENQPRDPDLDIQLFAKVLDTTQGTDLNKANITGLASLETVRVEARVEGPASQLDKNLELVSSPARSQTEIVALLGGGFIDTQGRGGDSTLGLINIAGSAVLNNLQGPLNQLGTALGLSELRVFPTILSDNPEAGRNSSSLELAAEAGIDITRRISVSGLKILTTGDPVQWGVNYRLNDSIRLRGTTNFSDDNRAVVEYQKRF
ncbi:MULTISPECIES: translocation/assembly module TamB [Nostocales]|uniref:Translocation/assembly module TamB n=3 Tax=Nostocales TaxID=1161 RepID=A0A0C1QTC5_9CYAN|nr:translocation/assembly module TamB [Tolypothrix bouteillei]KAF3885682.1 translocation/assembly module TamB [Tolypothrix bouteillei VB521301]